MLWGTFKNLINVVKWYRYLPIAVVEVDEADIDTRDEEEPDHITTDLSLYCIMLYPIHNYASVDGGLLRGRAVANWSTDDSLEIVLKNGNLNNIPPALALWLHAFKTNSNRYSSFTLGISVFIYLNSRRENGW